MRESPHTVETPEPSLQEELFYLLNEGSELFRVGKVDDARRCFEEALTIDAHDAQARNLLGLCLYRQGQLAGARTIFEVLLRETPDEASLHLNLAMVCLKQDDLDTAEAALDRVLTLNPDHDRALAYRARVHERRGALDEALLAYERVGDLERADALRRRKAGRFPTTSDEPTDPHPRATDGPRSLTLELPAVQNPSPISSSPRAPALDAPDDNAVSPPPDAFAALEDVAGDAGEPRPAAWTVGGPPGPPASAHAAATRLRALDDSDVVDATELIRPIEPSDREPSAATQVSLSRLDAPTAEGAAALRARARDADPDVEVLSTDAHAAALTAAAYARVRRPTDLPSAKDAVLARQSSLGFTLDDDGVPPPPDSAELDAALAHHPQVTRQRGGGSDPELDVDRTLGVLPVALVPRTSLPQPVSLDALAAQALPQDLDDARTVGTTLVLPFARCLYARLDRLVGLSGATDIEPVHRRYRGRRTDTLFGGEGAPLIAALGTGIAVLSLLDQRLHRIALHDEAVYIAERAVLAFTDGITWENGRLPGESGDDLDVVHLRGTGTVLLSAQGALSAVAVEPGRPLLLRAERFLGWCGDVVPIRQALAGPGESAVLSTLVRVEGQGLVLLS